MTRPAVGSADSSGVREAPMSFGSEPKGGRTVRVRDPHGHMEHKDGKWVFVPEHPHRPASRIYVATKAMEVNLRWK